MSRQEALLIFGLLTLTSAAAAKAHFSGSGYISGGIWTVSCIVNAIAFCRAWRIKVKDEAKDNDQ
jgi:hypothetical protein